MINYETILSTFDDKLTLMQWLQKVEQALEGAGLESVEIHQQTPTTAYFKFVFADGTSVTTPSITLPRGPKGDTGEAGATGATGNGIASITKTGTSGLVDTYTILYTNGSTQTFTVTNGAQGPQGIQGPQGETGATGATGVTGNGIASILKTGTSGLVDTYTILYTNGSTQTFTVTNGAQGVSITNVTINVSNHLIVTLSNGTTIDAGEIQGGGGGSGTQLYYHIISLSGGNHISCVTTESEQADNSFIGLMSVLGNTGTIYRAYNDSIMVRFIVDIEQMEISCVYVNGTSLTTLNIDPSLVIRDSVTTL